MENFLQFINQLNPADVVVAKKKKGLGRVLNHYIVYVGDGVFIGNLKQGVKLLTYSELLELLSDYEPVRIIPFNGSDYQRVQAINRANTRIGDRYSLLNFNCEHFANWVQKGKEKSLQVTIVVVLIALGIISYNLLKIDNGKRR